MTKLTFFLACMVSAVTGFNVAGVVWKRQWNVAYQQAIEAQQQTRIAMQQFDRMHNSFKQMEAVAKLNETIAKRNLHTAEQCLDREERR